MAEFRENWFDEPSQRALARLVQQTRGLDGRVIEIGSWEGRSTVALANAAWPAVVDAVDTWAGSPGEISAELLASDPERDVYATWATNVAELTRGNVEPHRMGWRDYFDLDRGPVRFCFVDAEHSYREVYDNLRTVVPLMQAGGIVCGDAAHHEPVMRAVTELLGHTRREATLWIWEA
jgi:predicted O-methyltransferase YrrM